MKRGSAGERARQALRGHWAQALAWEGAVWCGTIGLAVAQGLAAAVCEIPMALPTPAFVQAHPALLYIAAAGVLTELLGMSPVRFGRTAFYVRRAAARLPFALFEPAEKLAPRPLGRYRRIVAGRLAWWGWNLLGAVLFLTTPAIAVWASVTLPDEAAPYPLWFTLLSWPLAVTGALGMIAWSLRMSPLMILLAAHPSWSVRTAARRALRASRGRTGRLVRRILGFFGWFFTCAAVIPIAYVQPMFAAAQAEWLLSAAEEAERENALCKAKPLYTRRIQSNGERFTWPATRAGQIRPRRSRAE